MIIMKTTELRKILMQNNRRLAGVLVEKKTNNLTQKRLFADVSEGVACNHFLVDLCKRKIYQGGIYTRGRDSFFGYHDLPVITF